MAYNLTFVSGNSTSVLGIIQNTNTELMFGWLGHFFLIAIGLVVFLSILFSTNDVSRAMASAMWLTTLVSFLLIAMNLISLTAVFICVIGSAAAVAFSWGNG